MTNENQVPQGKLRRKTCKTEIILVLSGVEACFGNWHWLYPELDVSMRKLWAILSYLGKMLFLNSLHFEKEFSPSRWTNRLVRTGPRQNWIDDASKFDIKTLLAVHVSIEISTFTSLLFVCIIKLWLIANANSG